MFSSLLFLTVAANGPVQPEVIEVINRNSLGAETYQNEHSSLFLAEDNLGRNRSIADWLDQVPGLSMTGQGGLYQSYSIRGLSRWRIKTEVDGIPILTDRRAGNSASFISPELLSVAQVVKGPSSNLYGSQAMGGVIALQTRQFDGAYFAAHYDSAGAQRSWLTGYGDDVFSGGLSFRQAKNSYSASNVKLHTEFEQWSGLIKYQFSTNNLDWQVSWLPSLTKDIGKSSANYPDDRITVYPEDIHSLFQVNARSETRFAQIYHHYQNWYSDVLRVGKRFNETHYQSHTLGGLFTQQVIDSKGRIGIELTHRLGVKVTEDERTLDGIDLQHYQLIAANQRNLGVFADFRESYDRITASIGSRIDWINQTQRGQTISDSQISANGALSWQVDNQLKLSASASSGFRFPSLVELYFNGTTPRGSTLGNPDLNPETSLSYEFNTQWKPKNFELNVSVYSTYLDQYIERYRKNVNTRTYRNVDRASIRGFEVAAKMLVNDNWSHEISYQNQSGDDHNHRPLADLIPEKINYKLNYQQDSWSSQFFVEHRFSDLANVADGEQGMDRVTLVNFVLRQTISEHLNLGFLVNNLTDQNYFSAKDEDAPLQPGRSVGINVEWIN